MLPGHVRVVGLGTQDVVEAGVALCGLPAREMGLLTL